MAKRKTTVERPYCGGRWTKARFFSFIRSALRKASIKWPPLQDVMKLNRRPYVGPRKNVKWEHQCNMCKQWFLGTQIERDHIVECGSLSDWDDIPGFCRRLFCEVEGVQKLCVKCHVKKHQKEADEERNA